MNYIYDILLNFDSMIYDHYEWDLSDNIYRVKKIPIFKVDKSTIYDIFNFNLCFKQDFLNKIKNKTEIFLNKNVKFIEYAFIVCYSDIVIAVKLDSTGKTFNYSKMLISEELDVIDDMDFIPCYSINYDVVSKKKVNVLKTKNEIKKTEFLKLMLKNSSKEQLEYLYYELFNKKYIGNNIKDRFDKELNIWSDSCDRMFEFFCLISNKNY